jgi:ADP-dependent glucokinase
LNANVDLIVSGTALLKQLNVSGGSQADHDVLGSVQDLQEIFEHRMARCAAAERVYKHEKEYLEIVEHARSLKEKQYFVGGNAALVGLKMASTFSETRVLLGGPVGDQLYRLLLPNMEIAAGCKQSKDEIHLILEYKKGEVFGSTTASCSNRFIFSHDIGNSNLIAMESFFSSLKSFEPNLIVLSGLHLLEKLEEAVWQGKINELVYHLSGVPDNIPIHLELASTASLDLLATMVQNVFPRVTSVGLNDQELLSVSKASKGPHQTVGEDSGPLEVGVVADQLYFILNTFGAGSSGFPDSRLTRVHFHSFTFHFISIIQGTWENSLTAVGKAARMAPIQACDSVNFNADSVELKFPQTYLMSIEDVFLRRTPLVYNPLLPVSHWTRENVEMFMSPVLICRKPTKTVGLGDAISATALQNSLMVSSVATK